MVITGSMSDVDGRPELAGFFNKKFTSAREAGLDRAGHARRPSTPRAFLLIRHRDPTGVSGAGIVAEGTEWTDGSASLRWRGEHPTTTFFETGIRSIAALHGHSGATEILYADGLTPERTAADFEYPLATGQRVPTASTDGLCQRCGGAWPCARCPDLISAATA